MACLDALQHLDEKIQKLKRFARVMLIFIVIEIGILLSVGFVIFITWVNK